MKKIIIYDLNLNKIAILENAFNVGYEQKFNNIWTATFSLPLDDPKNKHCQHHYYAEIFDGSQRIELFRILNTETLKNEENKRITYTCEHVLATLIDDVLFQYHQIGGMGVYTQEVLQYILSHQTNTNWVLGSVEFNRQFLYNFENENLLTALFSVPKCFNNEYQWTWDTLSHPWTLNLVAPDSEISTYIRYRKNLKSIIKTVDPSDLCTRIYPLGYGEGVNQLTIKDVNPTGQYYIDADTQNQYGIISRVWVDRRYEDPQVLYDTAKALLEKLKIPRISYLIDALDLYQITKDSIDNFKIGKMVQVTDGDITFNARIIKVTKKNIFENPDEIKLEIANNTLKLSDSIATLADRTRVNENYAQGATNLENYTFADNCDQNHPAVIKFYIPEETVRINKVLLNFETEPFRAYSRAVSGGGAVQTTTSAGGHMSDVTESGGDAQTTTSAGGHMSDVTEGGGGIYESISFYERGTIYFSDLLGLNESFIADSGIHDHGGETFGCLDHNHGIPNLTILQKADGGTVGFVESGWHTHDIEEDGCHYHRLYDFSTYIDIPDHTHSFELPEHSHEVDIPEHSHSFEVPDHTHQLSLPDHVHEIEHGIYSGPTPTALTIKIDSNNVPNTNTSATNMDIIPYLSKDGEGKIQRGWHTIEIRPNNLGRIVANIVLQVFVQSRGGGNF